MTNYLALSDGSNLLLSDGTFLEINTSAGVPSDFGQLAAATLQIPHIANVNTAQISKSSTYLRPIISTSEWIKP